jgi:RNA polymerase sigma-70 factor (ECF subfamily)
MPAADDPAVNALLERAGTGDREAAAEAVLLHDEALRRVIRVRLDRRVAQRVDVEDVLQETHVEALERLPEFLADRKVPLFVWLRFLAVQRCMTLARRHLLAAGRDARREQPMAGAGGAEAEATSMALEEALVARLTSPSRAAAKGETKRGVRAAVEALDPLDREILCLRHFEELDNAEAAMALGIGAPAASKRYVRALVRLREALDAQGLNAPPSGGG